MKIAGLQKISLIDYPGKVSTVIFTQGCNFRCGYCHNPQLVLPELFEPVINEKTVFEYLDKRKGKIEGVVVTGGEPTLHNDLAKLIRNIKKQNFLVKLDTNGSNPAVLKNLLNENLLDFVAMDVKAPLKKYSEISGVNIDTESILASIKLIKGSGIKHQFRTTVVRRFSNVNDLLEIKELINEKLYIQNFTISDKILNSDLDNTYGWTEDEIKSMDYIIN